MIQIKYIQIDKINKKEEYLKHIKIAQITSYSIKCNSGQIIMKQKILGNLVT